jgi:hypothetical protein
MIRGILRVFLFGASLVLLTFFVIFLFEFIFVFSIFHVKKVVITRTYIINRNWTKDLIDNHIIIYRLQLADSSRPIIVDSIFRSRDPEYDPFKAFVRDTCTWFEAHNIPYNGTSFRKRKIYFDRPNGFKWKVYSCDSLDSTYRQSSWSPPPAKFERRIPADDSIGRRKRPQVFYTKRDTIGALELNRWYAFEGLTRLGHIYFVYVDSTGCTRGVRTLPPWFKPI